LLVHAKDLFFEAKQGRPVKLRHCEPVFDISDCIGWAVSTSSCCVEGLP